MQGRFHPPSRKIIKALDVWMAIWFPLMLLDKVVMLFVNPTLGSSIFAVLAGVFVVALIAGCSLYAARTLHYVLTSKHSSPEHRAVAARLLSIVRAVQVLGLAYIAITIVRLSLSPPYTDPSLEMPMWAVDDSIQLFVLTLLLALMGRAQPHDSPASNARAPIAKAGAFVRISAQQADKSPQSPQRQLDKARALGDPNSKVLAAQGDGNSSQQHAQTASEQRFNRVESAPSPNAPTLQTLQPPRSAFMAADQLIPHH